MADRGRTFVNGVCEANEWKRRATITIEVARCRGEPTSVEAWHAIVLSSTGQGIRDQRRSKLATPSPASPICKRRYSDKNRSRSVRSRLFVVTGRLLEQLSKNEISPARDIIGEFNSGRVPSFVGIFNFGRVPSFVGIKQCRQMGLNKINKGIRQNKSSNTAMTKILKLSL